MTAFPNKAVSPKDYTVCIGNQAYSSPLSYSDKSTNYSDNIYDLTNTYNISNLPSYSIVGEFIFTYPELSANVNRDIFISCNYKIDSDLLYKCRYIRLIITPNISCYNSGSIINVFFNVGISFDGNFKEIQIFRYLIFSSGDYISTKSTKYAVIYDLKKDEIYIDTDNPIEQWSDSNQLPIYVK